MHGPGRPESAIPKSVCPPRIYSPSAPRNRGPGDPWATNILLWERLVDSQHVNRRPLESKTGNVILGRSFRRSDYRQTGGAYSPFTLGWPAPSDSRTTGLLVESLPAARIMEIRRFNCTPYEERTPATESGSYVLHCARAGTHRAGSDSWEADSCEDRGIAGMELRENTTSRRIPTFSGGRRGDPSPSETRRRAGAGR